jgi:hypothetical protein
VLEVVFEARKMRSIEAERPLYRPAKISPSR